MERKRLYSFAFCLLLSVGVAVGQRAEQLRLNEVLSYNTENFQDDYGVQSPWIEIFNTSYAKVSIEGCYLTDDPTNPTKYKIPRGNVNTQIPSRQHILFWADNRAERGAFHLNFSLDPMQPTWIALYNPDGTKLIDSVTVPPLQTNQSWGRVEDGKGEWAVIETPTPSTNNKEVTTSVSMQRFKQYDGRGFGMALTAMSVVFSALALLWGAFAFIGKLSLKAQARAVTSKTGAGKENAKEMANASEEVYVAIAMALYEVENEAHDMEEHKLTIEKVHRTYSPWNSKIYAMLPKPRR